MISLLLHKSEAEPRTSIITMISSEYTGYNYYIPVRGSVQKFTEKTIIIIISLGPGLSLYALNLGEDSSIVLG